jgi:hypothetical protein
VDLGLAAAEDLDRVLDFSVVAEPEHEAVVRYLEVPSSATDGFSPYTTYLGSAEAFLRGVHVLAEKHAYPRLSGQPVQHRLMR